MVESGERMQVPERVELGGLPFDRATLESAAEYVVDLAAAGVGGIVVPSNVATSRHLRDLGVPELLERATLWPIDGVPLTWLLRLAGLGRFQRVAGTDLMNEVVQRGSALGVTVAIIGAAADLAVQHYRGLGLENVVGGDLPFAPEGSDLLVDAAAGLLDTQGGRICFVCLGFPKQEALALALQARFPDMVFVGAGAGAQMNSGTLSRAPVSMQRVGLEWLWRLAQQPRRLAKRYLLQDLPWLVSMVPVALRERSSRPEHRTVPGGPA